MTAPKIAPKIAPETRDNSTLTFEHYTKIHHHDTYDAIDETAPENSCAGKSVFITGAGTGIGKAIAIAFARAGARAVFLTGRTQATIDSTKVEIKKYAPETIVECYSTDVANELQVNATFEAAAKHGPIDILVNNAGYVAFLPTAGETSFDTIWKHFEVNVKGKMLCTLAFLKHAQPKGATLIDVSSGAAVVNFADGLSAYSASKVATHKMMDYVHREEAGRDLRVFNIHPGIVPTAMAADGKQDVCDTAELPGSYCVWLSTPDADFLKGRFMYVNWDINELKANKEKILSENLLTLTVKGMDTSEWKA
jgi:NAD(P)-dependent dehydrogenase (short-subunit alcohol dehydrogenase family)